MRLARHMTIVIFLFLLVATAFSSRIKDIANLAGVRNNQLVGYGLVVGLDGTGDNSAQAPFTDQTFKNMLIQFGIRMPEGKNSQLRNIAAVAISATLPPFSRVGQKVDVTILSLGNATSLRGGSLLMTPLRGADGKVYAMSQGSVVISGFGAQGADGSKVTVNSESSGTIPNGATIENTIDTPFVRNGEITLELAQADFTTAERVEQVINHNFGYHLATALNAREIIVKIGKAVSIEHSGGKGGFKDDISANMIEESYEDNSRYIPFISRIENIELSPAEVGAKVIVNSRTGTIVIGSNVTIAPVAVTHGNLSVIVSERMAVSQPNAFANGKTVVTSASDINVHQQNNRTFLFAPGPSLNDLVAAVNAVGAAPGDLISILEAIKASGALNADLEVI